MSVPCVCLILTSPRCAAAVPRGRTGQEGGPEHRVNLGTRATARGEAGAGPLCRRGRRSSGSSGERPEAPWQSRDTAQACRTPKRRAGPSTPPPTPAGPPRAKAQAGGTASAPRGPSQPPVFPGMPARVPKGPHCPPVSPVLALRGKLGLSVPRREWCLPSSWRIRTRGKGHRNSGGHLVWL